MYQVIKAYERIVEANYIDNLIKAQSEGEATHKKTGTVR